MDIRLVAISGLVVIGLSMLPDDAKQSTCDPRVVSILEYLLHLAKSDTPYIRFAIVRCIPDYIAGLRSITRHRHHAHAEQEQRQRAEQERADKAREAGEELEVEDLSFGIEKKSGADVKKSEDSQDAERVLLHLSRVPVLREGFWKLLK
jgi:hypothetical protein